MTLNGDLAGQRVLITGGSRGIGRGICEAFARTGARIALTYVSREALALEAAEEFKKYGAQDVIVCKADVSIEADVVALAAKVMEKWGGLDVLVNNAGMNKDALLLRLKSEDWDQILNVNLKGTMLCVREFCKPMMKQRVGSIINISSVIGEMGNAGQAAYSASKAGIIGFTKSVARELASRNICANVITPGFIETEMTESMDEKQKEALVASIPLGRVGSVKDVAELCLFLASPRSRYITGQVIGINGGLYI